ncbi:hypothetical protein E2562_031438 [Oryza meyeriana var. granulata]|uniref:Protein BIG GRAIN 1-like n=1 Tax=Oryza meyeriana var. granulata TaxID=110450 RepID=A0A6G1BZW1_9ORYZ|nr:hypothetical protein E2562_031438 [Oryza meyeriana var. granulata]
MREMEMRWAARPRPRRRAPDQPSFSSTLLDAICDSMDEDDRHEPGTGSRPRTAAAAKKRQEAAASYFYKPSLAASYRARAAPAQGNGAASPADCHGRGYFSSSEVEYSLRRLRPIRTSAGGGGDGAAIARKQYQQPAAEKARTGKKPASASGTRGCRRPASPGARLASLLNSIFSGKRPSAHRPACSPDHQEPACSTAPPSSYARPCLAKTPSTAARARPSRSRTVRFLDIDGKVAVAAAVAGCRRIPVMEVEADTDGGEESSDASSDLFELDNLAAIAPAGDRGGSYRDELPVYGTTGVGIHRDIGRRRPYGYALGRSCSRVV